MSGLNRHSSSPSSMSSKRKSFPVVAHLNSFSYQRSLLSAEKKKRFPSSHGKLSFNYLCDQEIELHVQETRRLSLGGYCQILPPAFFMIGSLSKTLWERKGASHCPQKMLHCLISARGCQTPKRSHPAWCSQEVQGRQDSGEQFSTACDLKIWCSQK